MRTLTRQRPGEAEHPLLGLPARDNAVTVALSVAAAALFLLVALDATRPAIQRIDDQSLRWMLSIRTAWLTAVAKVLNLLGLIGVTLPVRLAVIGFLALRRRWWHLAAFAGAVVVSEALIGPLKTLYDRPRPPGSLVHTTGGSFPSGHAVAASVTVLAAVVALFPEGPRRFAWGAVAALFALVMALSRAYLAAHWLSDVLGGVLLGTACAMASAVVVHRIRVRGGPRRPRGPRPG